MNRGFTLLEVLVVLILLSITAAFAIHKIGGSSHLSTQEQVANHLMVLNTSLKKVKNEQVRVDAKTLRNVLKRQGVLGAAGQLPPNELLHDFPNFKPGQNYEILVIDISGVSQSPNSYRPTGKAGWGYDEDSKQLFAAMICPNTGAPFWYDGTEKALIDC